MQPRRAALEALARSAEAIAERAGAASEAASAGELGGRCGVVAREVKALADLTRPRFRTGDDESRA